MYQPIQKKWVAALLSGTYQQTTGVLNEVNGQQQTFCCLGVLCDLAAKEGIEVHRNEDDGTIAGELLDSQPAVKAWAGTVEDGGVAGPIDLAKLNDLGVDFKTLAKLIDQLSSIYVDSNTKAEGRE